MEWAPYENPIHTKHIEDKITVDEPKTFPLFFIRTIPVLPENRSGSSSNISLVPLHCRILCAITLQTTERIFQNSQVFM